MDDSTECCLDWCSEMMDRAEGSEELILSRLLCYSVVEEADTFKEVKDRTLELLSVLEELGAEPIAAKAIVDELAEMRVGEAPDQVVIDDLISRAQGVAGAL